ncbi:MAG: hypothetical protein WC637_00130 [Victivallales bacterium]|jgi:hypothetical protein
MHRIQIDQIEGIYDVHVGCQQAYYITAEALLADLKAYLTDPEGTQKRYFAYRDVTNRKNEPGPRPEIQEDQAEIRVGSVGQNEQVLAAAMLTPRTPR